jgi:hypothetical protein
MSNAYLREKLTLGQHTEEVLRGTGPDGADIAEINRSR